MEAELSGRSEARRDRDPKRPGPAVPPPRLVSGGPLLAFDAQMRVVAWNESFERLTGLAPAGIGGRPCWSVVRGVAPDGAAICGERCAIALDAIEGRPQPGTCLDVASPGGKRRVCMATLATSCDGARLFVHAFVEPGEPEPAPDRRVALTPRQAEVLRLLGAGLGTREIASRLTLSEHTVKNHVRAVLAALGCHTRLEAVVAAQRLGLLRPGDRPRGSRL